MKPKYLIKRKVQKRKKSKIKKKAERWTVESLDVDERRPNKNLLKPLHSLGDSATVMHVDYQFENDGKITDSENEWPTNVDSLNENPMVVDSNPKRIVTAEDGAYMSYFTTGDDANQMQLNYCHEDYDSDGRSIVEDEWTNSNEKSITIAGSADVSNVIIITPTQDATLTSHFPTALNDKSSESVPTSETGVVYCEIENDSTHQNFDNNFTSEGADATKENSEAALAVNSVNQSAVIVRRSNQDKDEDNFFAVIENPINVLEVLNDDLYSRDVLTNCRDKKLTRKNRATICDAIIEYARQNQIKMGNDMFSLISIEICRIFTCEKPTTYFKNTNGKKSGYLRDRYYYRKRIMERLKDDVHVDVEMLDELSDDVASCIEILKHEGETDTCYHENWEKSFEYRSQQYQFYETIEELLKVWPIIGKPIGPYLIEKDFERIYGEKSITSEEWNNFFSRNWQYLKSRIKDPKGLTCCKKVARIPEKKAKDAALSYLMHFVLVPAYAGGLKKYERGKNKRKKGEKGRKPSIVESKNTFFKYMSNEDIDIVIHNREVQCAMHKIKTHPFIIGYGPSKYQIEEFYIIFGDCRIEMPDFITALNTCMKMFILFKIPYPAESRAVWILLNKIFYDIHVHRLMTARMTEIYTDLQL